MINICSLDLWGKKKSISKNSSILGTFLLRWEGYVGPDRSQTHTNSSYCHPSHNQLPCMHLYLLFKDITYESYTLIMNWISFSTWIKTRVKTIQSQFIHKPPQPLVISSKYISKEYYSYISSWINIYVLYHILP